MRSSRRSVRYIPQLELVECGAASLAMVLDFHGCSVPLVEARAACAVSRDGVSATRILHAARSFGLEARGLRLEPSDLHKLPLPAILHWELNHFLVLERLTGRGAVVVDPACGRRHVAADVLHDAFSGVALAFAPTAQLARRPHRSRSLGRYFAVLAAEKRALALVALGVLQLQLLGLLFAASTQVVVDHVIKPQRASWLLPIAIVLLGAVLVRQLLQWLRDRVLVGLNTALDLTLLSDFVHHLMQLPLSFFDQRSAGEIMQRVEANGELRSISASLTLSVLDALLLAAYAGLMLAYDLRLGLLTLSVSCARVLLVQLARQRMRQRSELMLALAGREQATLVEALSAPEMMRALGAEGALFGRYSARFGERLNAELALKRMGGGLEAAMTLFDGAAVALLLWLGGTQVIAGGLTVGVFAGFLMLQRLADAPLVALLGCVERYFYAQAVLARVDDVLDTEKEPTGSRVLAPLRGEIVFDKVSFRHGPTTPWLFQDLSFRIAPGEKVALVGRSGQGKSTIMQLLLGVARPASGRILIDGVPLDELDRQALSAQLGVVVQEPFLLADTLENNLRLRVPHATPDELARAVRIACLDEVIEALPAGYGTQLGQGRVQLSGGQRQRLAVARAVLGDPRLLLLDEATSSLDLATEARLHENLGALHCTRLVIAHRLATVEDADRILVIDDGAIVQEGRYEELARRPGLFRALVEAA